MRRRRGLLHWLVGALCAGQLAVASAGDPAQCVGVQRLEPGAAVTIDPGRIPGTSRRRASSNASAVAVEVRVSGPLGVALDGRVHAELVGRPGTAPIVLQASARRGIYAAKVKPGSYLLVVRSVDPAGAGPLGLVTPPRRVQLDQKLNEIAVELATRDKLFYRMGDSLVPFSPPGRVAIVFAGQGAGSGAPGRAAIAIERLDALAKQYGTKLDEKFLKSKRSPVVVFDPLPPDARASLIADIRRLEPSRTARIGEAMLGADGLLTLIDARFVFRFDPSVGQAERLRVLSMLGLTVVKVSPDDHDVVVVEFTSGDLAAHLAAVHCLVEQGVLVTGEPDLVRPWRAAGNRPSGWPDDPDYVARGSRNLTNQRIDKAWDLLFDDARQLVGKSDVRVGVLDWPPDPEDPDLKCDIDGSPQLATCWVPTNFIDGGDGTCPSPLAEANRSHGAAVLGIIAACTNNGFGVAGIAPGVRLNALGFRLSFDWDYFSGDDYADKMRWLGGLVTPCAESAAGREDPCRWPAVASDVINNSYQMTPPPDWNMEAPIGLPEVVATLFNRLVSEGRGGKGTILVFAAGNFGVAQEGLPHIVGLPTKIENPIAADPRTISVSNCQLVGSEERLYRDFSPSLPSNFGDRVDVCADGEGTMPMPSVCAGITPCPSFGATSAAAATVTGIVALMLTANPDLTWCDVREILRSTAAQVDKLQQDADGQWINGESKWYGKGRVDAEAAVREAMVRTPHGCSWDGTTRSDRQ